MNASYEWPWPILKLLLRECCPIFSCSGRSWKLRHLFISWGALKQNSTKQPRSTKKLTQSSWFQANLALAYIGLFVYWYNNHNSMLWGQQHQYFGAGCWECHTLGRHGYQLVFPTTHEWKVCNLHNLYVSYICIYIIILYYIALMKTQTKLTLTLHPHPQFVVRVSLDYCLVWTSVQWITSVPVLFILWNWKGVQALLLVG